ncbi:MAG: geranylgeranyl reductase family protein [Actinomycetota bacterium]|nr:geranylgeranyl reductase family protein [Actinomycetota bacterium]
MQFDRPPAAGQLGQPVRTGAPGHDCDAVVVGGGPAGAAAAARLAAQGFQTVLVDRASFPRDKVCGDFVGPAALAELADLGVAQTEAFRATSKMADLALHVDGDQLTAMRIPQVDGLASYGRVIPRLQLDAWILDAARHAGATILEGRKVTAVQQAPDAITVRGHSAAGPWQLRTRLLLGADGSNSIIARTLHGGVPPRQDRIVAVRAYFDDVGGPDGQGDVCFTSDSFPGYYWLFPAGGGSANLGVGMLVSTYPQSRPNLREMLLRLIAEDASLQDRLRGARMRGKILGHPLTTYNPRLPLTGDRLMLLGDAAGLINPLNGEGIQYALHSARWAADIAADCLACDRLDAASLQGYQRRVHQNLRADMALSRLIIQLFRNRNLDHVWLSALRTIAIRARTDPAYAHRVSCVLTGLTPAVSTLGNGAAAGIFGQALLARPAGTSWHRLGHRGPAARLAPDGTGDTARYSMPPGEFKDWAAGTGRALAEFTTQLARTKITRSPRRGAGVLGHGLPPGAAG